MKFDFTVNMTGKNCLITGATSGHGEAVARYLAAQGAHVIIHGRNSVKLEKVRQSIFNETHSMPDILTADFSSMESIRAGAQEFISRNIKLDLLVNNAGLVNKEMKLSTDGYEEVFAVNYLAMHLFTLSILDSLKKNSPSRIVIVASDAHYIGKLNLNETNGEGSYSLIGAYARSKLAVVYFTLELAEILKDTNITVNAVDPGPVASGIAKKPGIVAKIADALIQLTFPKPMKAAKSCLYLSMAPEVEGRTGGYFRFMKFKKPKVSDDPNIRKELWEKTVAITGADFP